jgi:hypothetical protein
MIVPEGGPFLHYPGQAIVSDIGALRQGRRKST